MVYKHYLLQMEWGQKQLPEVTWGWGILEDTLMPFKQDWTETRKGEIVYLIGSLLLYDWDGHLTWPIVSLFVYNEIQRMARLSFLHQQSHRCLIQLSTSTSIMKVFLSADFVLISSAWLSWSRCISFDFQGDWSCTTPTRKHFMSYQQAAVNMVYTLLWFPAKQLTVMIHKTLACWIFTNCHHSPN